MMLVFFHHDEDEREHVQGDTEVSSWITSASGTCFLSYLKGQFECLLTVLEVFSTTEQNRNSYLTKT